MNRWIVAFSAGFAATAALPVMAQPASADPPPERAPAASAAASATPGAASDLADGEIRRIDREGGRLTLRHGEIRHLDMPAMTMAFQVREPAMLDGLKVGDKVRFRVEAAGSSLRVTAIEVVR